VGQHLEFAVHQQRQGGRLHPARRPCAALLAALQALGQGAGGVHANQPIRIGAAFGGAAQALQVSAGAQCLEAPANGLRRHGLQPQPLHRLLHAQKVHHLAEDQLAFAPGIAAVHHALHIRPLQQLRDGADAVALPLLLLQLEALGDDGQNVERPALELLVNLIGLQQLEEMPHREGDQVVRALPPAVLFAEAAQGRRDVPGHAGLFGDDE